MSRSRPTERLFATLRGDRRLLRRLAPCTRSRSSCRPRDHRRLTADAAITEIGALKHRGGELPRDVRDAREPGRADPAASSPCSPASPKRWCCPRRPIDEVLPAFLEFVGDAVIVGAQPPLRPRFLDAALARRRLPAAHAPPRRHARRSRAGSSATRSPTSSWRRSRATSAPSRRPVHRALRRRGTRPPRCCTRCSSGRPRSACSGSTTSSRSRGCARTRRPPSSRLTARRSRAARASTCSATGRGRVLYVGKARNLRTTVRAHFSAETGRRAPRCCSS